MKFIILAGGVGSRFWPASRAAHPKQLLPIVNEKSMLANTIERILPMTDPKNILVIGGIKQEKGLNAELDGLAGASGIKLVIEPVGRNTAAAIALGVAFHNDPDDITIVLPADHYIRREDEFRRVLQQAADVAMNYDVLLTLGIKPTYPETGFGYIACGKPKNGYYSVTAFCEKPDRLTAKSYVEKGDYYWNAGMFIFKNRVFLEEANRFIPDIIRDIEQIAKEDFSPISLKAFYPELESISIDYAVMEKTHRIGLIPMDIGWNDVGSWLSLKEIKAQDNNGNVSDCELLALDATNNIISTGKKFTVLIGVHNLIAVQTPDALMICNQNDSQKVREIVEHLKESHPELL